MVGAEHVHNEGAAITDEVLQFIGLGTFGVRARRLCSRTPVAGISRVPVHLAGAGALFAGWPSAVLMLTLEV